MNRKKIVVLIAAILIVGSAGIASFSASASASSDGCMGNYQLKNDLYNLRCESSIEASMKSLLGFFRIPTGWIELAEICESYKKYVDAYEVLLEAQDGVTGKEFIKFHQSLSKNPGGTPIISTKQLAKLLVEGSKMNYGPLCPSGPRGEKIMGLEEIRGAIMSGKYQRALRAGDSSSDSDSASASSSACEN